MANDSKPIVLVAGIPGHPYLARALEKEFSRPVVGIVNFARIDETYSADDRAAFRTLYSLPAYYLEHRQQIEALSLDDLNRRQNALEEKLGVSQGTLITYFDRALRWAGDYRKVRNYQLATLQFVDWFLQKEQPAFALDAVVTYLNFVLIAACRRYNIPYITTQNSRLTGYFNVEHEDGRHVGMLETFAELQKGNTGFIDAPTLRKADEKLDDFLKKPVRPAYAIKNSVLGFDPLKELSKVAAALAPEKLFPPETVREVDRPLMYENGPVRTLANGIRNRFRRTEQKVCGVFDATPDLGRPYIYLPLHYAPEISDMYFGTAYDHHAGFVTQLAKHIPSDTELYVKEHTSMLGYRPTSFYRELNTLYNVRVIAPSVSTFTLIKHARALATVTGTAGWEAYLLGRPVVALGNVFYNRLPGIYYAQLDGTFKAGLDRYLKTFASNPVEIRNAFRAFVATCYDGAKGDIGHDTPASQAVANASLYTAGLRKCIENWNHTMQGAFPEEMLTNVGPQRKTAVGG